MERTKMPNLRNGSKGDSTPGSLDCESAVLPLNYRTPHFRHMPNVRSVNSVLSDNPDVDITRLMEEMVECFCVQVCVVS